MWLNPTREYKICEKCGTPVSKLQYRRFHGENCSFTICPEIVETREAYIKSYSDFINLLVTINNYHNKFLKHPNDDTGQKLKKALQNLKRTAQAVRVTTEKSYEAFEKRKKEVAALEPPKKYKGFKNKNVDVSKPDSGDSS